MIKYRFSLQCEDQTRKLNGEISLEASDVKSPAEFREYLSVAHDTAMKTVSSCNNEPPKIPGGNKPALLPEPSPSNNGKGNQKPASPKQIGKAKAICRDKGITPNELSREFGVSRPEDMDGSQIWNFINQNK